MKRFSAPQIAVPTSHNRYAKFVCLQDTSRAACGTDDDVVPLRR